MSEGFYGGDEVLVSMPTGSIVVIVSAVPRMLQRRMRSPPPRPASGPVHRNRLGPDRRSWWLCSLTGLTRWVRSSPSAADSSPAAQGRLENRRTAGLLVGGSRSTPAADCTRTVKANTNPATPIRVRWIQRWPLAVMFASRRTPRPLEQRSDSGKQKGNPARSTASSDASGGRAPATENFLPRRSQEGKG